MGDFRDKLLQAGLVSAEQVRDVEAAVEQHRDLRGSRSGEGGRRDARANAPQQDRRDARGPRGGEGPQRRDEAQPGRRGGRDGERAAVKSEPPPAPKAASPELEAELSALIEGGWVGGKTRGHRRWYYASHLGTVPFIELSDEVQRDLQSGNIALCEDPRGEATLITAACAEAIIALDPGWVRVWTRR